MNINLIIFKLFSVILFQDSFSISEGIGGSVKTYTFNFTYSNSECGHSLKTVPVSFCESEVCSYTLETSDSLSFFERPSQVMLTVFASNILGDGLPSNISYIGNIQYRILTHIMTLFECIYNVILHRCIKHVISCLL